MHDDPTIGSEGGADDVDDPSDAPGVDLHIFETEWAVAWEDVPTSATESVPVLDDIVARMLATAGYDLGEAVTAEGEERELLDRYESVHEAVEAGTLGDDPGDVADAINSLSEVYDALRVQLAGSDDI
jgi:hypothetical protein